MFKSILLPTDGSEQARYACQYAITLAKQYNAVIQALYVLDIRYLEGPFFQDISASLGMTPYSDYQGKLRAIMMERGEAILQEIATACAAEDIACDTKTHIGFVRHIILEATQFSDLIVMGRTGEHAHIVDIPIGNTTHAVCRAAKKPVIVTGSLAAPRPSRILLAHDWHHHTEKALQTAAHIAYEMQAELSYIVVGKSSDKQQEFMEKTQAYLDAYPLKGKGLALNGSPAECILEEIQKGKYDLVVMGSSAHSRLHNLMIENTAEQVLHGTPYPVLFI